VKTWSRQDLNQFERADEIGIAPLRPDGSLGKPVTIWMVRLGDELYLRSAYGPRAGWFRATKRQPQGRITGGGLSKEVMFETADPRLNDEIDVAYRSKYRRHPATYVNMMISHEARSTTTRVAPRPASS